MLLHSNTIEYEVCLRRGADGVNHGRKELARGHGAREGAADGRHFRLEAERRVGSHGSCLSPRV